MKISVTLLDVSDETLAEEYNRRQLGDSSLDSVFDFEIEQEYEDRGLDKNDPKFQNASDQQLIDEMKNRGLDYETFSIPVVEMAEAILHDMHQSKCVKNRVRYLIEKLTGRMVCN